MRLKRYFGLQGSSVISLLFWCASAAVSALISRAMSRPPPPTPHTPNPSSFPPLTPHPRPQTQLPPRRVGHSPAAIHIQEERPAAVSTARVSSRRLPQFPPLIPQRRVSTPHSLFRRRRSCPSGPPSLFPHIRTRPRRNRRGASARVAAGQRHPEQKRHTSRCFVFLSGGRRCGKWFSTEAGCHA